MRDTVVVLISDYKLFVGDIYQGKIKQIPFKTQDYWEVFDSNDLKDFLEYMEYPLGYKKFKGSHLKVYFNEPLMYQYIYEVKKDLVQSESMEIGYLPELILDVLKAGEPIALPLVVECLEKQYKVETKQGAWSIHEIEDHETEFKVTVEQICKYIAAQEDKGMSVEDTLNHYVLFSPVTLLKDYPTENKRKYLEVDNKLLKCLQEGEYVQKGTPLLEYEQIVFKLFGKKECKTICKQSLQDGKFVNLLDYKDEFKIAKNAVIGIVVPKKEERSDTLTWLKRYIKEV